jgi:iron complex outermembrane receptor protein
MNPFLTKLSAAFAATITLAPGQQPAGTLSPLTVHGMRDSQLWSGSARDIGDGFLFAQDGAALLRGVPGAAVVRNGEQTGIAQIRGLAGDRVKITVDGRSITPACPNHMDPPLHYAQPAAGDRFEVFAGIAPVSAGGDSIAGVIRVARAEPVFADAGDSLFGGRFGGSFRGSQDVWSLSGSLHHATDRFRSEYRGGWMTADDLRFPGGRVRASGFETQRHEWIGSVRTDGGYVSIDTGLTRTRDAGTPALPMDMVRDDSWHFGIQQREDLGWAMLETRAYVHDVDHLMDNFSLRPAPAMRMQAPATSRDYGLRSALEIPRGDDLWIVGIDLHRAEFQAEQVNAMGQRRDTFNDNVRTRGGGFIDWETPLADRWTARTGLRADVVETRAGMVASGFGGPAVMADRDAFNAGPRRHRDTLVDATAALRFEPDDATTLELGIGLKNRAPSLVERYLWTPANASAGLADGRTYLGNPALDPELSFQIGLGATRRGETWSVTLTPFYQSVRDFIQGEPHPVRVDAAGLPVLQYQNIRRAELYGVELAVAWELHEHFTLAANASHTRAQNRENGDALYRVAPLRGMASLVYQNDGWEAGVECEWAAAQNRVARGQNEPTTPGYGLVHLRLARELPLGVRVEAGVENVFDKRYSDHLGGVNRVAGGDVAVGGRIPGTGRFFYSGVNWTF